MADPTAFEGSNCGVPEKLGNNLDMPAIPCAEALAAPSLHQGGGDCSAFKAESVDDEASGLSKKLNSVMCARATSSSTPVGPEDPFFEATEDEAELEAPNQGFSKMDSDPFIEQQAGVQDTPKSVGPSSEVAKERAVGGQPENDSTSPVTDEAKEEAVPSGGAAEESALHEHAPATVVASRELGKEELGQGKPVIDSVTDDAAPADETAEDSDHYEDAPTAPDNKGDCEGDKANSVANRPREEAARPDEPIGDPGRGNYEDASFELDKEKLKGDGAEPVTGSVGEEQVPASLPTGDSPLFEDASSFHEPDADSPAVAQLEKLPTVPVDQVDKVSGTSAADELCSELEETPPLCGQPCVVVTSNREDQVQESTHVNSSCSPAGDGQVKSWAEQLADEPDWGKDVASLDLEGGHEAAADPIPGPGLPGDESEEEDAAGEELELHAQPDELDCGGSLMEGGTTGPGEGEEVEEDCIEGERQQGDGEESVDAADVLDKQLDFDEDKRNPQYIPKKGAFYQHDDRMVGDEEVSEVQEEKNEDDKGSRRPKKLWQDEGVWSHDMFREEEQGPKTSEELVAIYGYDIRNETMPPRARRRRRYGRGPNKYQRNWEDEDAYSARPGFGRGGGMRGGHKPRGGSHLGNPSFRDEDFPDLNAKPPGSESAANQDRPEGQLPAKPFKGSEHRTSDGPQPHEWDNSARNLGQSRRGWGKRPQAPRRVSDGSPKQPENELVKEVAPLSHRGSKPAPRPQLKTSELPPHSAVNKARSGKHIPSEQERSLRNAELSDKPVPKVEMTEGGGAESKNTAMVAPRTGPLGSTESTVKPKRYSSLRQRPIVEAAPYTPEPSVVASQLPSSQAPPPPPGPSTPQPAILTAAHFRGPYAPYPDGYMLPPPGQAPTVMPPPNQPPPVMAPPGQIPGSFLPAPTGLVSFPPQYPPPYTFPAQYAAPAPAAPAVSHVSGANISQTQAQKPPYYHGDIIYYNTQSQQHKQRPTPPRRPKAAIPIVPPPDNHGGAQEGPCEPDGCASHQSRSDEDLEDRGIIGAVPTVQEGLTGQQAVGGL